MNRFFEMIPVNIEVSHRHRIVCKNCDFSRDAYSAEEAKESAADHINEDIGDENPRPHYDHTIEITPITIVRSI